MVSAVPAYRGGFVKRLCLTIFPILLFSSLSLTACDPKPCGQTHRGWAEATVTSGPNAGAYASVYMEWTSMGWGPHCVGKWTGNPHPYPDVPFTRCAGGATGGTSSGDGSGNAVWMRTSCGSAGLVFEVLVSNYRQGAELYSRCNVTYGAAVLNCRAQHVT